jgi:hypothetical protein
MVWLYRSHIPVGRKGVISTFNYFIHAFVVCVCVGGGGSAPCGVDLVAHVSLICFVMYSVQCTWYRVRLNYNIVETGILYIFVVVYS